MDFRACLLDGRVGNLSCCGIIKMHRYYISQSTKRLDVSNTTNLFPTATFHLAVSHQNTWGRQNEKYLFLHWNAERFIGDWRTIKTPDFEPFTSFVPSPQRARISDLNRMSPTLNSELNRLTLLPKLSCLYNMLITLSFNNIRTRVFNFPEWRNHWNFP